MYQIWRYQDREFFLFSGYPRVDCKGTEEQIQGTQEDDDH